MNKPKISIGGRSPEWFELTIQENKWWKFGKSEKYFVPREKVQWLSMGEILDQAVNVAEELSWSSTGSISYDDVVDHDDPPIAQNESKENYEKSRWTTTPTNNKGSLFTMNYSFLAPFSYMFAQWHYKTFAFLAICLVGWSWVYSGINSSAVASASSLNSHIPQTKIERIETQIQSLREQRESSYDSCIQICQADRYERDAQVTELKAKRDRAKAMSK